MTPKKGMVMNKSAIAKIVFDYIKIKGGVSLVEVENIFSENGFDYTGDCMLATSAPNIIMWADWNAEAVAILKEIIDMGAEFSCSSILIYLYDGKMLNIPIAKSAKGYKKELHWLPVVLNVKSDTH